MMLATLLSHKYLHAWLLSLYGLPIPEDIIDGFLSPGRMGRFMDLEIQLN
jgi:hypothetical protein